jgi:outer membrane protein OmpA-like peptidoglycan-associated protein
MTCASAAMAQGGPFVHINRSKVLAAAKTPAADQLIEALKAARTMRCPRGNTAGCGDPQAPQKSYAIFFARGSARVGTAEMAKLRQLARQVSSTPRRTRFLLVGQTDASGDARRNHRLALQRAIAVRSLLVSRFGIPSHRLVAGSNASLANPEDPLALDNRCVRLMRL